MKTNNVLFADKISDHHQAFLTKLQNVAVNLDIPVNWLMLIFYVETGAASCGVINHRARNPRTKATGLIQFMPDTAKNLGTTVDALLQMSNVDQLDYVERYLQPYAHKIKRLVDCYLAVLFPAAIGKAASWVLETKKLNAGKIADYNPLYDLNKDGKVTVGEVERKLLSFIPKGFLL